MKAPSIWTARPMSRKQFWRYVRGLTAPVLLWSLFAAVLVMPLQSWLRGDEQYDEATIREWIDETRPFRLSLPELARDYLKESDKAHANGAQGSAAEEILTPQNYKLGIQEEGIQ